jgi:hypothetical protein
LSGGIGWRLSADLPISEQVKLLMFWVNLKANDKSAYRYLMIVVEYAIN